MDKKQLVTALRELMKQNSVDAVYITGCDPHGSDGVATHWRVMQWFSGFSGTTGCCVVTMDKAAFWSDGRYVAQMVRELDQAVFECINTSDPTSLSWTEWVGKMLLQAECLQWTEKSFLTLILRSLKIRSASTVFLSDTIRTFQVNFGKTVQQFQMLLSGNWN